MHPCVEIPDDSHTLTLEGGDKEADGEVHYVVVDRDLYQSSEGPKASLDLSLTNVFLLKF
jgi:hypothetical protein